MLTLLRNGFIQRFAAWRSGGFLAQKFNRRTALETSTKLSYEALNPPLRQTAVPVAQLKYTKKTCVKTGYFVN